MPCISGGSLLTVPLEIRRQVYRLMLCLSLHDHLNLMLVCQQIYAEARESYFERPLVVQSQEELIRFVQIQTDVFLSQMTNIHLHLQEVNREIMHPYLARAIQGISTPSEEHPYVVETNRILGALFRLPNISRLRVSGPQDPSMSPPSGLLTTSVLSWAGAHYLKLDQLGIDLGSFQLDSLSGCGNLKTLEIQGVSESSTMDLLKWCSQLSCLKSLTIHGFQQGLQLRHQPGFHNKFKRPSSQKGLAHFPPLKRLSIHEYLGPSHVGSWLTTKVLQSLHGCLGEHLKLLHLSCNQTPPALVLGAIAAFLGSTQSLCTLRLMWPGIQVSFLDCIPSSVTRLELAATSSDDGQNIVDRFMATQSRVPRFEQVKFDLIHDSSMVDDEQKKNDDGVEVSRVMVISRCQGLNL